MPQDTPMVISPQRVIRFTYHDWFMVFRVGGSNGAISGYIKILNDGICAMGDPIHFMFDSRIGLSGSADRMALFPITSNPSWRQAAILRLIRSTYIARIAM